VKKFEALSPENMGRLLDDPAWRILSGSLYQIIVKGDDEDDDGLVLPFVPNVAQRHLLARLWNRNLVLKARQRGITTLIAILWLDTALFSADPVRCVVVAHEKDAAESIFRDKVVFAYNNLPDIVREHFPLTKKTTTEILFAHNGASIKVSTSARSGTAHRLHISEFGKISARYPGKAIEVVSGSIPAVPTSGVVVIESTAEGQEGKFYEMTTRAMAMHDGGRKLTKKDYRFHFFAWWDAPEYELDPENVVFTAADNAYFAMVESKIYRSISLRKRAWYVVTRQSDFSDDAPLMWREYPSYPEEAFQASTEGCYYSAQISAARKSGRIVATLPQVPAVVNTFWDLGRGDMTAVWLHQRVGHENRFIRYYEASGEDLSHYAVWLQQQGVVYGKHYLPHEADHKRMGTSPDTNRSLKEQLEDLLPGQRVEIVPRVSNITAGIQATRNIFASCWFDESGCQDGIKRLANYRKKWDRVRGCWMGEPEHNDDSHGSDAFRQFGQVADTGEVFSVAAPASGFRRRGSAMAV
jgi:hypothetical protein